MYWLPAREEFWRHDLLSQLHMPEYQTSESTRPAEEESPRTDPAPPPPDPIHTTTEKVQNS